MDEHERDENNGCRLRSPDRPRTSPFSAVGIGRPTRRTITLTQDAKFTKIEPERRRGVRVARGTGDAKESKNARIGAWRYVEGERVRRRTDSGRRDGRRDEGEDGGGRRGRTSERFVSFRSSPSVSSTWMRFVARMDGWLDGWMPTGGSKRERLERTRRRLNRPSD